MTTPFAKQCGRVFLFPHLLFVISHNICFLRNISSEIQPPNFCHCISCLGKLRTDFFRSLEVVPRLIAKFCVCLSYADSPIVLFTVTVTTFVFCRPALSIALSQSNQNIASVKSSGLFVAIIVLFSIVNKQTEFIFCRISYRHIQVIQIVRLFCSYRSFHTYFDSC